MLNFKKSLVILITVSSFICLSGFLSADNQPSDNKTNVLEVILSQHLYADKAEQVINKQGDTISNVEATLHDDFMILHYSKNTVDTLVDWTICEDKGCPKTGQYNKEDPYYTELLQLVNKPY